MRKHLIFLTSLFIIMFISAYCFAMEHIQRDSHKLSGKLENGVRVIEVKASRYKFKPDPIVVNLGEKVRLVVTAVDTAHGIAIPDFNVDLRISEGKTEIIEFTADSIAVQISQN